MPVLSPVVGEAAEAPVEFEEELLLDGVFELLEVSEEASELVGLLDVSEEVSELVGSLDVSEEVSELVGSLDVSEEVSELVGSLDVSEEVSELVESLEVSEEVSEDVSEELGSSGSILPTIPSTEGYPVAPRLNV